MHASSRVTSDRDMKFKQLLNNSIRCELCGWTFHLWSARHGRPRAQGERFN